MIFSNQQLATSCRLPFRTLVFESATGAKIGYIRYGWVGLALGKAG